MRSIIPANGYGNHSCQNCLASPQCPCKIFVATQYGGESIPNRCSMYWPPNAPASGFPLPASGSSYWTLLQRIALENQR
jgi:hypothetical protein